MQSVALNWLVYNLTHSSLLLGIMVFANQIPTFLLASFVGVIADRADKRRILIFTQIAALVQALAVTLVFYSGEAAVGILIVLNVMLGLINSFDIVARQSFLVEMVEDKNDLSNAIALNSSLVNVARLAGPAMAGFVIAKAGEGVCFFLNTISFVPVIYSLYAMRVKKIVRADSSRQVLDEMREGFIYTFRHLPIRSIITLIAFTSLTAIPFTTIIPVLAKDILGGDAGTYGTLAGASGCGAIMAAIYLAARKKSEGLLKQILVALVIFGAGLIGLSFAKTYLSAFTMVLLSSFGMMLQVASSNTLIQMLVDSDKRGRVMSIYTMGFMGMMPFGALLIGALAHNAGAQSAFRVAGFCCFTGVAVFGYYLMKIQKSLVI